MVTKKFIIFTITAIMLCFTGSLHSQNMNSLQFINSIADKEEVTVGEAVKLFLMITENKSGSFEENVKYLKSAKVLDSDFNTGANDALKRGLLAKMIAKKLNLKDSLLGLILPFERYAHKACIAENIMQTDTSEWDAISGGELIEIMTAVSVILETGGKK